MDYTLSIIRHKDAKESTLEKVIAIKQKAWPYPIESQMMWIKSNLKDDDLHFILMLGSQGVAYLNLCKVQCTINDVSTMCWGIGNVCSAIKGMGYGYKLMSMTNKWLKENNQIGLLFCHAFVEPFYKKCGWIKIDAEKCEITGITPEIFTYAYNISQPLQKLKYTDRFF